MRPAPTAHRRSPAWRRWGLSSHERPPQTLGNSPTNNGQGGPGFTVPDENLPSNGSNNYPAGTVAMANAGAGTAGSQFFIVYKDTTLPANYTIWGKVVSGLDVVSNVAAAGVQGGGTDGKPAQPIVITKATTRETMQVG